MARFEQDREDLLNEAIGYSNRVLFRVVPSNKELFIGRRESGATSFYLGTDIVFQFNSGGQLRRAFLLGKKILAEYGKLFLIERDRGDSTRIVHQQTVLDEATSTLMTQNWTEIVDLLVSNNRIEMVGSVPPSSTVPDWVVLITNDIGKELRIANSANAQ